MIKSCLFLLIVVNHFSYATASENEMIAWLQWQYRIVLVDSNQAHLVDHITQITESQSEEIENRKLLFVVLNKKQHRCFPSVCKHMTSAHWKSAFTIQQNQVLLIGLDGSVKERYKAEEFKLEKIFADIDMMPMRRREINN